MIRWAPAWTGIHESGRLLTPTLNARMEYCSWTVGLRSIDIYMDHGTGTFYQTKRARSTQKKIGRSCRMRRRKKSKYTGGWGQNLWERYQIHDGNFIHGSEYPWISGPSGTGMEDRLCPRISWGRYPIINGAGTGKGFAPWIFDGYPGNMSDPHVSDT
jgi:hypothetical protein